MRFGASNQGNSNVDMKLGTSRQENSYDNLRFQSGKPLAGEFICSFEVGYFQTGFFSMKLGTFKQEIVI